MAPPAKATSDLFTLGLESTNPSRKSRKEITSSTTVEMVKGSSTVQKAPALVPSSNAKRKSKKQFSENVNEPMVLESANLVESYIDQSLQILNKDGVLDDLQMLGDITKHLNQIINSLENIYKKDEEVKEEDAQEDSSQKAHQDMTESLLCFSVISSQLESSFDEEREILESLAKWFGKEAQLMEELGEEDHAADSVLPVADKSVVEGISKVSLCVQKLERLKNCIQNLPGYPSSLTKQEFKKDQDKRRNLSTAVSSHKDPRIMLEDLVKKHGTEDVISMTQIFDSAPAQTFESMNPRVLEIVKVFERQTNKLQRISNEQNLLEAKYEKIKNEYQLLAEEKQIVENELRKMKEGESLEQEEIIPACKDTSVAKPEKSASKEKAPTVAAPALAPTVAAAAAPAAAAPAAAAPAAAAPAAAAPAAAAPAAAAPAAAAPATKGKSKRRSRKASSAQTKKESDKSKMQEDLLKAQEHVHLLQKEKLILEEKLKRALQEAEKANKQLTNLASSVPFLDTKIVQDTQIGYKSIEKGKNGLSDIDMTKYARDIPKRGQKITKSEDREDLAVSPSKSISEADELVHKLLAKNKAKQATQKSSEEIEETKEFATLSQKKDVRPGKKGEMEETKEFATLSLKKDVGPGKKGEMEETKEFATLSLKKDVGLGKKGEMEETKEFATLSLKKDVGPGKKGEMEETKEFATLSLKKDVGPGKKGEMEETKEFATLSLKKDVGLGKKGEMEETKEFATLSLKKDVRPGKKGVTEEKKSEDHGVLSSKLKEKYLFQEQGEMYKPKALLSSMEETPAPPDEKTASLLTGKTQQMPTVTRASIESESSLKFDPKGTVTVKKTPEVNEEVSLDSRMGEDACGTTDLDSVSLPKIRGDSEPRFSLNYQEQLLSKSSNVHKDSPQLISERQKTAMCAKPDTQGQDESLSLYENNMLPTALPSKYHDVAPLKSPLCSRKTSSESQDAEEASLFPVEKIPSLKTQEKMPAVTAQEDKKAPRLVFPVTPTENVTWETHSLEKKKLPWSQKEVVDVKDEKLFSNAERLPLITQMHQQTSKQASTHSLAEAGLNTGKKTTELLHSMLAKLSAGSESLQDSEAFEDSGIDSIAEDRSNKLPKLLASLESNLKDLQEALALTDDKSSNESEIHRYELKRILAESVEAKLKDLQQVETFIADQLDIHGSDEKQVYDIPQTRRLLLTSLEPTLRDLQMADIISAPESINEDRLKELMNQKNNYLSSLEGNSQDLQQAQSDLVDQEDKYRFCEKKMQDLTGKRKLLLTSLESNWKDLQQTRNLAASQPPGMDVENKVKELDKERQTLVAEIEENLKNLQQVENVVISHLITDRFPDRCFGSRSEFFERKSEVPEKQPLNGRILQLEHTLLALPINEDRSIEDELLALKERILLPNLPSTLSLIQGMDKYISKKRTVPEAPAQLTHDRDTSVAVHPMMPSRAVSKIQFDFSTLPALVPEGRVQKPSEIELQKRKLVKKSDVSENKRDSSPSPLYQGEWSDLYISGKSYPLASKTQEAKRR